MSVSATAAAMPAVLRITFRYTGTSTILLKFERENCFTTSPVNASRCQKAVAYITTSAPR